jgi:two-component system, response regulator YesN
MYKILIVDDEEIVRRSISRIVDWDALGFSSVLQAENGVEALEISLIEKPDLILTDIKMPFMDGLQLAEAIRENLPSTFVVILSGHDEFKFAQQAIGLGILDYILKPLGAASLTMKMQEIRKKLDEELQEKQYLIKVKNQLHQSLPLLRESFLNTLVCTPGSKTRAEDRLKFLDIKLSNGPYAICVIEPDLGLLEPGDVEIYSFAIKNIALESLGSKHIVFSDQNGRIVIILCLDSINFQLDTRNMIFDILSVIQKSIELFLKTIATFGVGTTVSTLSELYHSYSEALDALEYKYTLGKGKIYNIYDLDYHEPEFLYPFDAFSEFMTHVKSFQLGLLKQDLSNMTSPLKEKNASPANIKLIFIELITELLKLLTETKKVSAETWSQGLNLYNQIEKLVTVDEMAEVILNFAVTVSKCLAEVRATSSKSIVSKAIEYVNTNYVLEDLSLYTTSSHIAVSAGYLSALFKKEAGINFSDYLTKVRMEKAIELLRATDMKTYEVAYKTGFSNPHYFSISFKKFTGRSPSEFRGASEEYNDTKG